MNKNKEKIHFHENRLMFFAGPETPSSSPAPAPEPVPETPAEPLTIDALKQIPDETKNNLKEYFKEINEKGYRSAGYASANINEKFKELIPALNSPDDSKIMELQSLLGVEADGLIGPKTIAAFSKEFLGETIKIKKAKNPEIAKVETATAEAQTGTPSEETPTEPTPLDSLNESPLKTDEEIKNAIQTLKNNGFTKDQAFAAIVKRYEAVHPNEIETRTLQLKQEIIEKIQKIIKGVYEELNYTPAEPTEVTTPTDSEPATTSNSSPATGSSSSNGFTDAKEAVDSTEKDQNNLTEAEKVNLNNLTEMANELGITVRAYVDADNKTKTEISSFGQKTTIEFSNNNYNFVEENLKAEGGYTYKQAIVMADIANKAKDFSGKISYTYAYNDFVISGENYNYTSNRFIPKEKWSKIKKLHIPYHWIINLLKKLDKYEE